MLRIRNETLLNFSSLLDEHLTEIADLTAQAFAEGERRAMLGQSD